MSITQIGTGLTRPALPPCHDPPPARPGRGAAFRLSLSPGEEVALLTGPNVILTLKVAVITVTVNNAVPSGLVAAYGFNEGTGTALSDLSGNGNNGSITGATWTASGRYGSALVFNGTNAQVTVPNAASLQLAGGSREEVRLEETRVDRLPAYLLVGERRTILHCRGVPVRTGSAFSQP